MWHNLDGWLAHAYWYLGQRRAPVDMIEDLLHDMIVEVLTYPLRKMSLAYLYLHALDREWPRHRHTSTRDRQWRVVDMNDARLADDGMTALDAALDVAHVLTIIPRQHHAWLRRYVWEDWRLHEIAMAEGVTQSVAIERLRTVRRQVQQHPCVQEWGARGV